MKHAAAFVLASVIGGVGCADSHDSPLEPVTLLAASGQRIAEFAVTVAVTAEMRRQGLGALEPLSPGTGLLLTFPVTGEVCVVNAGIPYAIDALYLDPDGTVITIQRSIPALDEAPRCATGVRSVLEVLAGEAADASPGDRLERALGR